MKKLYLISIYMIFISTLYANSNVDFYIYSLSNGSARINWTFFEDGSFIFQKLELQNSQSLQLRGEWERNQDFVDVQFSDISKENFYIIYLLFASNYQDKDELTLFINSNKSLVFNFFADSLVISSLACLIEVNVDDYVYEVFTDNDKSFYNQKYGSFIDLGNQDHIINHTYPWEYVIPSDLSETIYIYSQIKEERVPFLFLYYDNEKILGLVRFDNFEGATKRIIEQFIYENGVLIKHIVENEYIIISEEIFHYKDERLEFSVLENKISGNKYRTNYLFDSNGFCFSKQKIDMDNGDLISENVFIPTSEGELRSIINLDYTSMCMSVNKIYYRNSNLYSFVDEENKPMLFNYYDNNNINYISDPYHNKRYIFEYVAGHE